MTLSEFSERVAHYGDEKHVEDEDYFYTALNGAASEIAVRFPTVEAVNVELDGNSQTAVNMSELVSDFASFSRPAVLAEEDPSCARVTVDGRVGRVIFPKDAYGRYTIFYNKKIPTVDRDTDDVPFEGERLELLILGVAYRLLTIDESYDAAASVKKMYDESAYRMERAARGLSAPTRDVYGW